MRFAVFGAGGVGAYFGARLAQAGHPVGFVARGEQLAAMRRRGLEVESVAGDFALSEVIATDDPGEIGPVDAVLVCVKAWQLGEAAAALPPLLGPATFVVPLLNGVEAAEQLAASLGDERVLGGLCKIVSFVVAPGRVRHAAVAPEIVVGERHGQRSERTAALERAAAGAVGMRLLIADDIEAATWEKFLFIAPFSGVAALAGTPVGEWRLVPAWRDMLRASMAEVAALARRRGVAIRGDALERTMAWVDAMPPGSTSSLQRDILEHRPSELEAQVGAIVRLAKPLSLPVPVSDEIYRRLLPLEREARAAVGR